MQNVDHADVSCLLLHYFFIKEFKREKEKKILEVGFVCCWLVWLQVYVEKWIDDDGGDDDDGDGDNNGGDRQSPSFFFSFS